MKYKIKDGCLLPVEKVQITHKEFELFNEPLNNGIRNEIMQNYNCLITNLKNYCENEFIVWVHGSFVTDKANPNDMDLEIFLTNDDRKKLQENKFIEEIFGIMDEKKLHINFFNFLPSDLAHENQYKLNEKLELIFNKRNGNDIIKNCTGFFEIGYPLNF